MICSQCLQKNDSKKTRTIYKKRCFFSFFVKLVSSVISNQLWSIHSNSTFSQAASTRHRINSLRSIILQKFRIVICLHQNASSLQHFFVFFIFVAFVTRHLNSTIVCIVICVWFIWFLNQNNRLKIALQFYTIAILTLMFCFSRANALTLIILIHRFIDFTTRFSNQ